MSRDGTFNKDSHMVNCYAEIAGDKSVAVKRPGLLEAFDFTAGDGQGVFCWNGTFYAIKDDVLIEGPTAQPVADGTLWTNKSNPPNDNTMQTCVAGSTLYAFQWYSGDRKVYSTTDGISWNTVTTSATGLPGTNDIQVVYLGTTFYAFPNISSSVYSSSDCITWSLVTSGAPWSASMSNMSIRVWNNKIWVIGGIAGSTYYDDVYSSSNGSSWTTETSTPGFAVRAGAGIAVHNNYLWIAGGQTTSGTYLNDVWYSSNGTSWTQQTASAAWSARKGYKMLCSQGGKLFIVGGVNGGGALVDCYRNTAGSTWDLMSSNIGASSYEYHTDAFLGSMTATSITKCNLADINSAGGNTYNLSPATTGLQFNFTNTSAAAGTQKLLIKSTDQAWTLTNSGTLAEVTDVDYPASTVPGCVYLDGYFCVMDYAGTIFNSDLENPSSWNSLNYTSAEIEPDQGVAIAKHQNYIVAFKDRTTEVFYDAANPSGSPFSTMSNTALQIGCANGYSIASVDGGLFFMSKTSSQNRSVHYFPSDALTPIEVADENVQRILNEATLTTVRAWAGRLSGHAFYALNLVTSGITLVYDLTSKIWARWTLQTAASPVTLTSLTQSNGIATATKTGHGQNDGDLVTIAGATPSGYNGTFNITKIDANSFTYPVSSSLSTPATGTITATGHTEGYFPFSFFTSCVGSNYLQHESSGKIYEIAGNHTDDDGTHIDARVRTAKFDNGDSETKTIGELAVIGDKISGNVLMRYSDDDYETWSKYRPIDMSLKKPRIRRLGSFRRRSFEIRYTGDTRLRIAGLDI